MISPFEFEEAGHLRPLEARPSVSRDPQDVKREEAIRDFVVVLLLAAVFAGALFFLLARTKKTPLLPKLRRERWKDWRPLDE
jgi:hypothetical protein